MLWQPTSYAVILFISAAISAVAALAVWRRRTAHGGMALFWLMLAVVEWQLTGACEAAAVGIPAKILWAKIGYVGTLSSPVFLFIFALKYSQQERWLTRRNLALLWLIPAITFGLAVTNEWHHLIWTSFTPSADPTRNALIYGHGAWFWIMVAYVYLLLSTATLVLIRTVLRHRHLYRRQAALVLLAMPFPWIANILYVFNWGPFPGQDLTLVGFALTGALLTLNLYQFHLLDLVPIARDALIENMSDGVLVLDAEDRIVDLNPAAQQIISRPAATVIGQTIAQALSGWPDLVERYHDATEAQAEIALGEGEARRTFDLRISPLYDRRGRPTGRLVVLRDITERQRAEEALRESEQRFSGIFENATIGLYRTTPDGRILMANPALLHMLGCSSFEELAQRNLEAEGHEPAYPRSSFKQRIESEGQVIGLESAWVKRDGTTLFVRESAVAIRDEAGNTLHYEGTVEDITERKRTEEEIRQRSRELAILLDVSQRLASRLDLDKLLSAIARSIVDTLPAAEAASIWLYDEGRDRMVVRAWAGHDDEAISGLALPPDTSLVGLVYRSRQPHIIDNVASEPAFELLGRPALDAVRSVLGVPLLVEGWPIGVLFADSFSRQQAFDENDLRLLQSLASQAAIAIQNARLYESERKRSAELEALHQAGLHLTSTLELQPTLEAILDHALKVIAANDAHIFLYDGERLAFGAALWGDGHQQEPCAEPRPQGLTYAVARSGERIIVPDVNSHPLFQDYQWGGAIVGLPLRIGQRVVGVMTVAFERPHAFEESELRVLGLLADQAAIAIENARLYEETQQRATELGALCDVATAAAASIRLDETLNRVMAALQQTLRPDDIAILLVDAETNELVIRAHTGFPGGPTLMCRAIGVGIPGWVVQTGQPALLADVRRDERYHPCDPDARSELCVPLQVGERIIGAINLESRRLAAFSEEHLRLLSILASHLAAVIENARLFEEIEERRMYLEGVLGAAPDAIVTLDAHHRIAEWNSGAERLFGYSREEAVGQDLDLLVTNPDVLEEATGFRQMVMSGEELPPVETVRYRKDGSPMDVLLAASPILVEDELIGVVTVYTDITEHVRAEETLRRRAEELAALQATVLDITAPHDLPTLLQTIVERATLLLNAPGGGMYLCDPDRGEVYCVVSYNTLHDYTGTVLKYGEGAAGTVAQTGEPLIIDDYRNWSGRAAVYEEERPFTGVLSAPMIWQGQVTGVIHLLSNVESRRFTQTDLELLTLFANHAAIAVESTRLYEQAQREINERVRAEEALRKAHDKLEVRVRERTAELINANKALRAEITERVRAEEQLKQYELIVESANDALFIKDLQSRYILVNNQMIELFGGTISREQILDKTDKELMPLEDARHNIRDDQEVFRTGKPRDFIKKNTLEGQDYWFHATKIPLRDDAGNIIGLVGIARDITESRRMEGELRQAYSDLRASQTRLIQSERLAALGRLAASVAHEINNPLQGIGNYLSLISKQVDEDDPLRGNLDMVKLGFDRIAEIVRRLRAFYRRAGEKMESTDVNGVVERALALVSHQLSLGQVKVKTELAEQELPVLGSAGQLEQVLINLALNAQEAMPEGGELTVRTALCKEMVKLQVSDTGRGISEAEMSKLFKPFYGGGRGKGLGLGLWISHNIIEGHGGRIEVESQLDEGTTFTISLPAYRRTGTSISG
jgi:PAS domain S-box-containing protein